MPKLGEKSSEETRKKIRLNHSRYWLGKKFSEETKHKMSLSQMGNQRALGNKLSAETKQKMSDAKRGTKILNRNSPPCSEETKEKIRLAHVGKKLSDQSKIKMSNAKKGKPGNARGSRRTVEQKKKMSELHMGMHKGEKSGTWRGGLSFESYPFDWVDSLRESIRERDNYTCQIPECGIRQEELDNRLSVHHKDYNKDNLNPNNLISLCRSCHAKTNFNREYWIEYFKDIYEHLNQ